MQCARSGEPCRLCNQSMIITVETRRCVTVQAKRCCRYTMTALHCSVYRWRHSVTPTECARQQSEQCRAAIVYLQHLWHFVSTTSASSSMTMRSASDVDAAVKPTCVLNANKAQTPVSAISRRRVGRWQLVRAWTEGRRRKTRERFVTLLSSSHVPIA